MPHDFAGRIFQSLLDMDYTQWAALGGAAAATYAAYRRYTRISFDDVPGPENPSFLHGMLHSNSRSLHFRLNPCTGTRDATGNPSFLLSPEAGEVENDYLTKYGGIVRWKGPLGVRRFLNSRISVPPRLGS
jgi:hypothetical protein